MQKQCEKEVALLGAFRKMSEKDRFALLSFAISSVKKPDTTIPPPKLL